MQILNSSAGRYAEKGAMQQRNMKRKTEGKKEKTKYSKGEATCGCAPYRTVKMTLERADFIFGHYFISRVTKLS